MPAHCPEDTLILSCFSLQKIDNAWHDLHFWLKREVSTRKADLLNVMKLSGGDKSQYERNVFGRLIAASIEQGDMFNNADVVGNLFIFFFAGVRSMYFCASLHANASTA